MSEAGNDAGGGAVGDVGLALLLGGGVAEAMAAMEATLATVQGAAGQVLAGLSRMQAAGAAAAAVPPVAHQVQPPAPSPEAPVAHSLPVRPAAERFAPPAPQPAGLEQGTPYAVPVSVPGGDPIQPPPLFAAQAPIQSLPAAPPAAAALAEGQAQERTPTAVPVRFSTFAPPAPVVSPEPARAPIDAATPDSAGIWGTAAPERPENRWPAAPMTTPEGDAAAPRAHVPAAAPTHQATPTGGDVFLDGTRVGTWLADHLAREAGRPQTGGTGFDSRLTPGWPGTLQGN